MSVQRFEPAVGPRNYFSVAGGRTAGAWAWSAGLVADYANSPFVLKSCESATNCDDPNAQSVHDLAVVEHMVTWNLMGTLTPIPRLQIGLRLPLAYVSGDGLPDPNTGGLNPAQELSAFGMGDPALEGKVRILGEPTDMVVLAAALDVQAPLGHATAEDKYIGNDSPVTVGLRGIFDGNFGPVLAAVNLKGVYRKDATVGSATIGPEFRYGAALGYEITESFQVMAEGFGATRFSSVNGTNSLEIDGGVRFKPGNFGLSLFAGGGAGVIQGIGVPTGRAILGVMYVSEGADQDADGVLDEDDQCISQPEDEDGIADEDGCPEEDHDRDKIPDQADKCPLEPETVNGLNDEDGCPDSRGDKDKDGIPDDSDQCPNEPGTMRVGKARGCPDTDKDGVADNADQCKNEAEDTDGFMDTDGCPDPDNDGDGVPDTADECSDAPEIMNGFQDQDGCPDEPPDQDGDGISDATDQCVDQAETLNAVKDDDGCPEVGIPLATVTADEVSVRSKLAFRGDEPASALTLKTLDAVANGLNNHQEILELQVTVVTRQAEAARGPKRAQAVVRHLVSKGVNAKRLKAKGAVGGSADVRFEITWSTRKPRR